MTGISVSMDTLRGWLDQGRPVTVLDVRPSEQYADWAIPGSLHVDAYDALKAGDPKAMSAALLPRDKPVVTVCALGHTSAIAAQQLRDRGLEALNLAGGMKAWSLAWNSAEVQLEKGNTRVIQVRRTGKGCLSYLIGSRDQAAVVDASVSPEVYLGLAGLAGWKITNVLDTHVHADHLSRSRQLAELSGATLRLPEQKRVLFSFAPLAEGDVIGIGNVRLTVLQTPGHTPESACYLLDNQALLTGDTLFLTGVGRPDLETTPGGAQQRAGQLHASLQRILKLRAETTILAGHTHQAVAFDGIPLTARLSEVKQRIAQLQLPVNDFVKWILARIPPTPPNHQHIIRLNEQGRWPEGDPTDLEAGANRCAVS
jgi:glyoxylase-like metal-dependent hydrolase (beta-lactamase superfamily II)